MSKPSCSAAVLLVMLLVTAGWLITPELSHAATYTVDSCQHPDGSYAGTAGWTPANAGAFADYTDGCVGGGSLSVSLDFHYEHNYGDRAEWSFATPLGTSLVHATTDLAYAAGADRAFGSPEAVIVGDSTYIRRCAAPYGCTSPQNETLDVPVANASRLVAGVICGGGPGGRCPAGFTYVNLRRARLTLEDDTSPTFNGPLSGSLSSSTSTARVRALSYSASDTGGGVYRQRLLADGREVAGGIVDDNGGHCSRYAVGGGFSYPVPCRTTTSGALTLDTSGLADGTHDLDLEVYDATDANKASDGWSVLVDNTPPSVGDVSITGVAEEGETLRCGATVDGQAPRIAHQWSRADVDGSEVAEIPGADAASYVVTAKDVGRKLLCRIAATDGGGTTARSSTITSGPFAGGGLVVKGSPGSGGSSAAAGSVPGAASLPSLAVCTSARLVLAGTRTRFLRSYRSSRFALSGRLLAAGSGDGRGGVLLDLLQTVSRAGTAQRTKVVSVRTDIDGTFRAKVPSGPSRLLQVVDPGCGAVGPVVAEKVRGMLRASTSTRRVRNRQVARFRGRVFGGFVGRGLPLELQVRVGRTWKDVKAVTSDARGAYHVGYRFMRTYVRYTYTFRVVSRAGTAWPYLAARSRQVKVRVN